MLVLFIICLKIFPCAYKQLSISAVCEAGYAMTKIGCAKCPKNSFAEQGADECTECPYKQVPFCLILSSPLFHSFTLSCYGIHYLNPIKFMVLIRTEHNFLPRCPQLDQPASGTAITVRDISLRLISRANGVAEQVKLNSNFFDL